MNENDNDNTGSVSASSTDFGLIVDDKCHCLFCKTNFKNQKEFYSSVTNKKFKVKLPVNNDLLLSCKTSNVIYLITDNMQ